MFQEVGIIGGQNLVAKCKSNSTFGLFLPDKQNISTMILRGAHVGLVHAGTPQTITIRVLCLPGGEWTGSYNLAYSKQQDFGHRLLEL